MRTSFLLAVLVCLAAVPWSSSNQLFGQKVKVQSNQAAKLIPAKKESLETLVYFPRTLPAQELQSALFDLIGKDFEGTIVLIKSNNSLAIRLPAKHLQEAADLLSQLDKQQQLVHFKAQFVQSIRKPTDAIPQPAFQSISNAKADDLIKKLLSSGEYTSIEQLELITIENQKAMVQVGRSIPVITGSMLSSRSPSRINTVRTEQVGTILQVTPQINGDIVTVAVNFETSGKEPMPTATKDTEPSLQQQTSTTTLQTTVQIKSGNTVILGGLTSVGGDQNRATLLILCAEIIK
ncbi:MAG: hypothetical protein COA78_19635 [Blastopirellula sp.]|nr:MAG: hypothetical protein COA78_19635 [Blastopirellula sp.]